MADKYCYKEDCHIERGERMGEPVARLFDEEGDQKWTFPGDFTDEHIHDAIEFANKAYALGVEIGKERKAAEMRAVLGV